MDERYSQAGVVVVAGTTTGCGEPQTLSDRHDRHLRCIVVIRLARTRRAKIGSQALSAQPTQPFRDLLSHQGSHNTTHTGGGNNQPGVVRDRRPLLRLARGRAPSVDFETRSPGGDWGPGEMITSEEAAAVAAAGYADVIMLTLSLCIGASSSG
jgi:hypothetical protein